MLDFLQTLLNNTQNQNMQNPLSFLQGANGQLPSYLMNPLNAGANAGQVAALPQSGQDNNAILSNLRQQILAQSLKGLGQTQPQKNMNTPPMAMPPAMAANMMPARPPIQGMPMMQQQAFIPNVAIARRFLGQGGY